MCLHAASSTIMEMRTMKTKLVYNHLALTANVFTLRSTYNDLEPDLLLLVTSPGV